MKGNCSESDEEVFSQFLMRHLTLSKREMQIMLGLVRFKTLPKGAVLFSKGELTREYYLVIRGGVRTYFLVDGVDITTGFYTETDSLIPESTTINEPSAYYAACFEDSTVVISTADVEQQLFQHIPEFEPLCRKFSEMLLAKKTRSLGEYRTMKPEQRYLQLVRERPELIQRVPQYHLASFLGVRPESLSRIRKRLSQRSKAGIS